jgi:hypothetical protein
MLFPYYLQPLTVLWYLRSIDALDGKVLWRCVVQSVPRLKTTPRDLGLSRAA